MEDLRVIMEMIHNVVDDMELKGIYQWDNVYPNSWVISVDLNEGTLSVYEDNGTVKGIIVLNEHQDDEYRDVDWEFKSGRQLVVHRLCIDPKCQGQGIASQLMDFAEDRGRELGYDSIRLDTFSENKPARRLYEKLGYKIVGTVYFRKGKFYCFEKQL
jgi:Acetyltransferases